MPLEQLRVHSPLSRSRLGNSSLGGRIRSRRRAHDASARQLESLAGVSQVLVVVEVGGLGSESGLFEADTDGVLEVHVAVDVGVRSLVFFLLEARGGDHFEGAVPRFFGLGAFGWHSGLVGVWLGEFLLCMV
jgi:hypothetical protein